MLPLGAPATSCGFLLREAEAVVVTAVARRWGRAGSLRVCDEVRDAGVVDGIVAAVGVRLLAVSLLLLLWWLVGCRRLACTEPGDERGAVVRRRGRGVSVVTLRRVRVLNPGGNLGRVEGSGPAVSVSTASVVSISRGAMRNSRSSAFARVGGARGVFISKRRGFNARACSI